ncbi:MAG: Aminopeptidase YpdF [Firmicutes bacterium]|nr:Aminopeptidase YpdF [Bacillota bacterium]
MSQRIDRLRQAIPAEADALLITKPDNRTYISGFTGSNAYLLVGREVALLLTDFRYIEQASAECPYFVVRDYAPVLSDSLKQALDDANIRVLAFESDFVTFSTYHELKEKLGVTLMPTTGLVEKLRQVKDAGEVENMQQAALIAEAALAEVLSMVKPGVSEKFVALNLEFALRKRGAERLPFDIIAASGPRSSLPHGRASERLIERGDFLTLDFGAVYNGYCCDMTRTFIVGAKATLEQERVYSTVLAAQEQALSALRPGLIGRAFDKVARDVITAQGYGERFGHGLGHGVGRAVHEGPGAGSKSEDLFSPGMVITVEPGIYLPGWGGVRIEDMVLVTETGYRNFNSFPKELTTLG